MARGSGPDRCRTRDREAFASPSRSSPTLKGREYLSLVLETCVRLVVVVGVWCITIESRDFSSPRGLIFLTWSRSRKYRYAASPDAAAPAVEATVAAAPAVAVEAAVAAAPKAAVVMPEMEVRTDDGALVFKRYKDLKYGPWIQSLPRPELLDGTHAGDYGSHHHPRRSGVSTRDISLSLSLSLSPSQDERRRREPTRGAAGSRDTAFLLLLKAVSRAEAALCVEKPSPPFSSRQRLPPLWSKRDVSGAAASTLSASPSRTSSCTR